MIEEAAADLDPPALSIVSAETCILDGVRGAMIQYERTGMMNPSCRTAELDRDRFYRVAAALPAVVKLPSGWWCSASLLRRCGDIGVRVALGATERDVVRLVVRQALTMAVLGVAVGSTAAYWAMQALGSMLFQVGARHPITFLVAPIMLVGVALAAAMLPARRAAQVDPVRALASG